LVRRTIYLATAALVAMLILVPTALAQEDTVLGDDDPLLPEPNVVVVGEDELVKIAGQPLPKTGGPEIMGTSVILTASLLLGAGIVVYAVLRRRR